MKKGYDGYEEEGVPVFAGIILGICIIMLMVTLVMLVVMIQDKDEYKKVEDTDAQTLEVERVESDSEQIKVSGGGKEVIFFLKGGYNNFTVTKGDIIEYKEHPHVDKYNRITKVISEG